MRLPHHTKFTISLGFILILSMLVALTAIGLTRMSAIQARMNSILINTT